MSWKNYSVEQKWQTNSSVHKTFSFLPQHEINVFNNRSKIFCSNILGKEGTVSLGYSSGIDQRTWPVMSSIQKHFSWGVWNLFQCSRRSIWNLSKFCSGAYAARRSFKSSLYTANLMATGFLCCCKNQHSSQYFLSVWGAELGILSVADQCGHGQSIEH